MIHYALCATEMIHLQSIISPTFQLDKVNKKARGTTDLRHFSGFRSNERAGARTPDNLIKSQEIEYPQTP